MTTNELQASSKKNEKNVETVISSISSENIEQFLKFCLVGCTNVIISFIVFYICYQHLRPVPILLNAMSNLGLNSTDILERTGIRSFDGAVANVIGYVCGILNSFIWNRKYTFNVTTRTWSRFKRFVFLNLSCLVLSTISIFLFVDILNRPYKAVWFLTTGIITVLSYFGNKLWTFKKQ